VYKRFNMASDLGLFEIKLSEEYSKCAPSLTSVKGWFLQIGGEYTIKKRSEK